MKPNVEVRSRLMDSRGWLGVIACLTWFLASSGEAPAQGWSGYARDPQHSCMAVSGSQVPNKIRWKTKVDLSINSNSGTIYIHYGTPVITRVNTVLVPVKTTISGDYQVQALSGATGKPIWTASSTYTLPAHGWVPIFGITLTPKDRYVAYPGPGGTIYVRTFPDSAAGTTTQLAFYNTTTNGTTNNYYGMNPSAFNSAIQICTPISSDSLGNLYFGYTSSGAALPGYPNGIRGGLARISSTGVGTFIPASGTGGIVSDTTMQKVAYNCAPAFSADGSTVYVAVNNGSSLKGYLCALDSSALTPNWSVLLTDPSQPAGSPAAVDDDGSATPTVGPDGDVYYGVLAEGIAGNHYRGYLLHFDKTLKIPKLPSAFGWDDTASIVPATAVPSYTGPSTYLLLTKYNNYADGNGDGVNKLAVVDPNTSFVDPISGITAMQPVITVTGVTPDTAFRPPLGTHPLAVREWCINSAAIDVVNKCAVVNSEDGHVYRWDFVKNQLSAGLMLAPATSEAYTPTVIGPDGAVYAINDAVLYSCVGQ